MLGLVVSLWGCSGVTVQGRVVDGMTGDPVAGPFKVVAKTTATDASIGCQFFSAEVGADGSFTLPGLCTGMGYELEVDREDLWLADGGAVPDGGFPGPHDLKAWRAPQGSGLYLMNEKGEFTALKTAADVRSERILESDEKVRMPWEIVPDHVALVAGGQQLVLVGQSAVDEFKFTPLVASMPRWFTVGKKDSKEKYRMGPWWYLGTSFTDDKTFTRVEATVDASKVTEKRADPRAVRWMSSEALPQGRYSVMKDDDRRMYLVDFGAAPPPLPEDPEPPIPVQ